MHSMLLVITVLGVSCLKAPSPKPESGQQNPVITSMGHKAASQQLDSQAIPAPPSGSETQASPVAMKPSTSGTAASGSKPNPATSLGGHDRRLLLKPFKAIASYDFEAGPVVDESLEPELIQTIRTLETSLSKGTIPLEAFDPRTRKLASIMYDDEALDGVFRARCAQVTRQSSEIASVGLRVFARRQDDDASGSIGDRSALGLAIMTRNKDGAWLIEHFELDYEALHTAVPRSTPWDPFDTDIGPYN